MTFWQWIGLIAIACIASPTVLGAVVCVPFYGGKILAELKNIGTTLKGHATHLQRTDVRLEDHEKRITRIEVRTEVEP